MTEATLSNKENLKNFQQKVMNRSAAQLLCFQSLADYLLECCSAEAKPNTLSLCSFLPLLIVSIGVQAESRLWFILAAVSFLLHQILDIANKKQAYRLQMFSLGTYYVDHLYDSFSAILIVYITGQLFNISNNWLWFFIFLFAILPFYTHHLTMYYNQYMHFYTVSPSIEGLIILQVLFLLFSISPSMVEKEIVSLGIGTLTIGTLLIFVAFIWLVVFLAMDLKIIYLNSSKLNEPIAFKNLFVVFVLGYIMFENAVIEEDLLKNSNFVFGLFMASLMFCFSLIIGDLIMKYAQGKKFHQISINTLCFTAWIALIYAICAFTSLQQKNERLFSQIMGGILLVFQVVYFVVKNKKVMNEMNEAINS